jgi:alkylation response protein AidB-like acyl-CoA dehydrogenase
MAKEYVNMRNVRFVLHEVFAAENLSKNPYYGDYTKEVIDMTIDTAKKLGDDLFFPIYTEMDKKKPHLENGVVTVHDGVRKIMDAMGEGGWISAPSSLEEGGQQMPGTLYAVSNFIFHAANTSAASYFGLTMGSSDLIRSFGSKELNETYVPHMDSGKWQGTMALTEPDAGSSLGDITTSAEPNTDGTYSIKGQKIFISAGDYHSAENVVHLMLAKIKGGPVGVKGISLFVVPKHRPENGTLVNNDVISAGVFGKMGMKGCPILHLSMGEADNCKGWLVGEPHKGLSYMFKMMNGARISVGMMSTALCSAAYHASLEYCNERPQGRPVSNKDPLVPQSLIIEYADVKRMLLFQKAITEGCLSFVTQCAYYSDMEKISEGAEKEKYNLLLNLLTPIAKAYPSEMSVHSTSAAVQTLGGAGYCDDFPLEQYFRDTRINPIYEGTTGIQAMDLLARKIPMKMGQGLMLYAAEINQTIAEAAGVENLKTHAESLAKAMQKFTEVTMKLMGLAQSQAPEIFLADATLFLENAGIVSIAWQWLKMGAVAQKALAAGASGEELNFYQGKLAAMNYFFLYELPKSTALCDRLLSDNRLTLDVKKEYIN